MEMAPQRNEDIEQAEREFREATWAFWTPDGAETPPCIVCMAPAVALHEIDPKSLNRAWYEEGPEDSVPICDEHHQAAAIAGDSGRAKLRKQAIVRLQMVGDWKRSRVIREINTDR